MTADPEREALKATGLRVLRELAEGAVSDEHRLAAALGLIEYAVKTDWHDEREAQQGAANGRGRRGWST